MIRKASILWALAFAICSLAQTTSDDGTAITSNLPSSTDFAASVTAPPNSGDVTSITTDDTTQPDSGTGQNTDTSSETDNTTQGNDGLATTPDSTIQTDSDDSNGTSPEIDNTTQDSDVPDDSSSSATPTLAASSTEPLTSNVAPATTDDTTQPDSNEPNTDSTGQNTVTPPETDNTTQDSDVPDDSSSSTTPDSVATATDNATEPDSNHSNIDSTGQDTDIPPETDNTTQGSDVTDGSSPTGNVVQHTADEASVGADDNLTQNDTNQSPSDNSTESNSSLANSTPTNETESFVQDSANYPEGHVNASTPFPQSVITEMSSRKMRYHHYLWHQVREQWNKFTPEVQQSYRDLGWEPPHPARAYDEQGIPSAITDNYSGEDFLYMHREMIATVNDIIARNNESYGKTFGWKTIPGPGDPDWPVPPNYTIPDDPLAENASSTRKTDEFYIRIQNAERSFKDPVQLRNMTLGELGARMEVTIHAWLHMRFSENCSVGIRSQYLNKTNLPYIEEIWDDPQYNWLGDTYSSQLFPTFYKIHGWVDDRIEDWMAANNVTELNWNGTWTGGPWENVAPTLMAKQSMNFRGSAAQNAHNMDHSAGNIDVLEQVLDLFLKSGVPESNFAEDVKIDWAPWDDPK